MILVTVGMQLGFDRLIRAMDALAPTLGMRVVAQIGAGTYKPENMEAHNRIAAADFEELVRQSQLIISHAGIGAVLTAQRFGKPVVLVPRRADLGEHRNDHQIATVSKLANRAGVLVAMDETQLASRIDDGLAMKSFPVTPSESARQLHAAVTKFIETGQL
ncbi:glucuronosyltransferase [Erythrobacter insulae]|uniref:Glucuronosyltransferase n=1 Tax=Erythrobacter insulae TaxID=2584124 RepID=A0A547PC02_9SPHN|nr:glycosyltransferase [Erythrobacter insulae]TRD11673.1 glucuronosyltransferase [Erythrobacter insulae]